MRWGRSKDEPGPAPGGWFLTGAPLPGSEATVDAIERGAGARLPPIRAVDPAFNADAFVDWSKTVYGRAVAAWRTRNPEPLRPVMCEAVWDAYASHLLMVSTLPLAQTLMASASATPSLVGTSAEGAHQSALIGFAVVIDTSVEAVWNLPLDSHAWSERWLFQRPVSARTHSSGAVAVCPQCGAPTPPEETGRCHYCHADVTTRTAGWLVTRTATTMAGMAKIDDRVARVRERLSARIPLPPPPVAGTPLQPPRANPPPHGRPPG